MSNPASDANQRDDVLIVGGAQRVLSRARTSLSDRVAPKHRAA